MNDNVDNVLSRVYYQFTIFLQILGSRTIDQLLINVISKIYLIVTVVLLFSPIDNLCLEWVLKNNLSRDLTM